MGLSFVVGGILPYLALLVGVGGLISRILRWARAPQHLHWELFPYPSTPAGQTGELLAEVFTLWSLYSYNRRFWLPSLTMHYGIYLVILWMVLSALGVGDTAVAGAAGGVLAAAGAAALVVIRAARRETRQITAPVEYLNLALVMAIGLSGLITGWFLQPEAFRRYVLSLVSFSPVLPAAEQLAPILLLEVFLLYLPFSRMAHFAAKYFTYHKVKWGEMAR